MERDRCTAPLFQAYHFSVHNLSDNLAEQFERAETAANEVRSLVPLCKRKVQPRYETNKWRRMLKGAPNFEIETCLRILAFDTSRTFRIGSLAIVMYRLESLESERRAKESELKKPKQRKRKSERQSKHFTRDQLWFGGLTRLGC
jgi:hypothetical protein